MDIPSMIIGAGIAMLLANLWVWYGLPQWQARGQLRDRRRTEARRREDADCKQHLHWWVQLTPEENGASRSGKPSATDGN